MSQHSKLVLGFTSAQQLTVPRNYLVTLWTHAVSLRSWRC